MARSRRAPMLQRQPGPDRVAATESRPGLETPADRRRPLPHPDETATRAVAFRWVDWRTVIEDLEPE